MSTIDGTSSIIPPERPSPSPRSVSRVTIVFHEMRDSPPAPADDTAPAASNRIPRDAGTRDHAGQAGCPCDMSRAHGLGSALIAQIDRLMHHRGFVALACTSLLAVLVTVVIVATRSTATVAGLLAGASVHWAWQSRNLRPRSRQTPDAGTTGDRRSDTAEDEQRGFETHSEDV